MRTSVVSALLLVFLSGCTSQESGIRTLGATPSEDVSIEAKQQDLALFLPGKNDLPAEDWRASREVAGAGSVPSLEACESLDELSRLNDLEASGGNVSAGITYTAPDSVGVVGAWVATRQRAGYARDLIRSLGDCETFSGSDPVTGEPLEVRTSVLETAGSDVTAATMDIEYRGTSYLSQWAVAEAEGLVAILVAGRFAGSSAPEVDVVALARLTRSRMSGDADVAPDHPG